MGAGETTAARETPAGQESTEGHVLSETPSDVEQTSKGTHQSSH